MELTRWLGAAAVKRDLTDKMRDAQKKEVRMVCPRWFQCGTWHTSSFHLLGASCFLHAPR